MDIHAAIALCAVSSAIVLGLAVFVIHYRERRP